MTFSEKLHAITAIKARIYGELKKKYNTSESALTLIKEYRQTTEHSDGGLEDALNWKSKVMAMREFDSNQNL